MVCFVSGNGPTPGLRASTLGPSRCERGAGVSDGSLVGGFVGEAADRGCVETSKIGSPPCPAPGHWE